MNVDKLTWGEVIRAFKPDASDEEVDFVLWEHTCYPFDNEMTLKQLEQFYEKEKNQKAEIQDQTFNDPF